MSKFTEEMFATARTSKRGLVTGERVVISGALFIDRAIKARAA